MLQFEIKTKEEFLNTLKSGRQVILSEFRDESVVPEIFGFLLIISDNDGNPCLGIVNKSDENLELFTPIYFDYLAFKGDIPKGTTLQNISCDDEKINELYDNLIQLETKLYLFTTYYNPLCD